MKRARPDSRTRILTAARQTFAARGYAATGVDRLARVARVNKAMIYYHFASKQALYRTVLQEIFTGLAARLRAIVDTPGPPAARLATLVEGLVSFVQEHPYLPRIMLRELAEGGTHLDEPTLRLMSTLPQIAARIVTEGCAAGAFRDVDPVLVYFNVMGPIVMFLGGAPIREQFARRRLIPGADLEVEAFVRHLQEFVQRAVAATPEPAAVHPTPRRRTTR